jgi:hypothetical protein
MKKEIWNRVHYACKVEIFEGANVLEMEPEEIDEYCRKAGVVWEEKENKEIMIHGCGLDCYCHGGPENKNLRPRD